MFSKTDQKTLDNRNKLFGFLATLSITKRLTILYVVSVFILLATSAVFLDWVLVNDLEKEDHQFLASQTQNLRVLLQQDPENIPPGGRNWREKP